jgi:DNA-binding transcriptional LysR family regulator
MTTIQIELVAPFLAVAELGSFSAAAARLGIEKSSVSRAIARLEDAVGETLFFRTTRRVALTEAGQAARDRLREPFAGLDAAMRAVLESAHAPRGRVVVTAPADFGAVVLTDVLARFARRYPQVEVDVRISGRFLDLTAAGIDAGIRLSMGRLRNSTMKARKIGEAPAGIYASPAYAEAHGLPRTPEEARSHPWIVFPTTRQLRLVGPDGATDLRAEGRVSCDEMSFVHHAVLQGLGLGVVPLFLTDLDVRHGRLVPVLPRWSVGTAQIWFVTPPGRDKPSPALAALRDQLIDVLAARGMSGPRSSA